MPEPPKPYGPPSRGISASDVHRAADALLREGERPTIEKVRAKLGTGSPNTINPLLDAWWKTLSARLDSGPAALHRLPESVAFAAESLWMQALEEGRRRASQEQYSTARSLAIDKQQLEVRSHVLSLREGELESRLKDREHQHAALESQLQTLTTLLRKEQATRESYARRIATLETELLARTPAPKKTAGPRTPQTRQRANGLRRAGQLLNPATTGRKKARVNAQAARTTATRSKQTHTTAQSAGERPSGRPRALRGVRRKATNNTKRNKSLIRRRPKQHDIKK